MDIFGKPVFLAVIYRQANSLIREFEPKLSVFEEMDFYPSKVLWRP